MLVENVVGDHRFSQCADPESFVRGGPILISLFVDEGIEDPGTTINRPSSGRQRNAMMAQH